MSCNLGGIGDRGLAQAFRTPGDLEALPRKPSAYTPASALGGLERSIRPSACLGTENALEKAEGPVVGLGSPLLPLVMHNQVTINNCSVA